MTMLNEGSTGAKRQSWKKANPRNILIKLIGENPHDTNQDEENILEMLWDEVKNNDEMLRTMVEYWGANNYRSIVYRADPQARIAREQQVKSAKDNILSRIILLEWLLPNGKKLRDCNKTDCQQAGGWLTKVGAGLKRGQKVGQVYSERDLKKMING